MIRRDAILNRRNLCSRFVNWALRLQVVPSHCRRCGATWDQSSPKPSVCPACLTGCVNAARWPSLRHWWQRGTFHSPEFRRSNRPRTRGRVRGATEERRTVARLPGNSPLGRAPARPADFRETAGLVCVHFFLPGFEPAEIESRVEDGVLKVSAQKTVRPQRPVLGDVRAGGTTRAQDDNRWDRITHSIPIPTGADPSRFRTCFVGGFLMVAFARRDLSDDAHPVRPPP